MKRTQRKRQTDIGNISLSQAAVLFLFVFFSNSSILENSAKRNYVKIFYSVIVFLFICFIFPKGQCPVHPFCNGTINFVLIFVGM